MDKIYLRENGAQVSPHIAEALRSMVAEGWLELDAWEGQSPEAQQLWYNRCAQRDLAGRQAWILFSDLDEFAVLMDKYVTLPLSPTLLRTWRLARWSFGLCFGVLGADVGMFRTWRISDLLRSTAGHEGVFAKILDHNGGLPRGLSKQRGACSGGVATGAVHAGG